MQDELVMPSGDEMMIWVRNAQWLQRSCLTHILKEWDKNCTPKTFYIFGSFLFFFFCVAKSSFSSNLITHIVISMNSTNDVYLSKIVIAQNNLECLIHTEGID